MLENFRPGTLEKWGLGPAELEVANPEVILVRISAFGQTGPLSQRPGFAAVAEAMGGLRELVGEPSGQPARVGVSIGDSIAGLYGAFGAMMALYRRETRRAPGQRREDTLLSERTIDVALNEAVLSVMESLIPDHLAYGVKRSRTGGRVEAIAPSNAYPCAADTSVVIAGNGDAISQRFMRLIERPDLAQDEQLTANAGRWARRDELDEAIAAWTSTRTRAEVLALLESSGIPAGPIYTAADICTDDQYRARNMVQYFDVDTGDTQPASVGFPGIVPVLGQQSLPVRSLGPDLSEQTHQVLSELLGMEPEAVAELVGREGH